MEDFAGPTFSLGLDLDFDFDQSAPPRHPNHQQEESRYSKQSPEQATTCAVEDVVSSQSIDENYEAHDFQPETLISSDLLNADDGSFPILKRVKRGLRRTQRVSSPVKEVYAAAVDEEIEDISSPEDNNKGSYSAVRNGFGCSSWKFPSHGCIPLSEQCTSKLKGKQSSQIRNASAITSMEASSSKAMFSKLKTSPLRRRRSQLVDSDSDVSSSSEEDDACASESANIPTPALDELCEEYFRCVKKKKGDTYTSSPKASGSSGDAELLPPACKYFEHDDPRIQRLVRQRLRYFSPLVGVNNNNNNKGDADIDYMCQFSQKKEAISRKQGMISTTSNCVTGSWVTPNKCINNGAGRANGCVSQGPNNAGKRRVRAEERTSGSWFTGQGGTKVYVSKNGQEFTGQMAYRCYKKESGSGFKKSKSKLRNKTAASSKKKSKR